MEFSKVDDRFAMQAHQHIFFDVMDLSLGTDMPFVAPRMGGGFPPYNALGHLDVESGQYEKYFAGPTHLVQEPVFIARSAEAAEGDGWCLALVNNLATAQSELHLVDTRDFGRAKAVVKLPVRLRPGLHGNWVDAVELARGREMVDECV